MLSFILRIQWIFMICALGFKFIVIGNNTQAPVHKHTKNSTFRRSHSIRYRHTTHRHTHTISRSDALASNSQQPTAITERTYKGANFRKKIEFIHTNVSLNSLLLLRQPDTVVTLESVSNETNGHWIGSSLAPLLQFNQSSSYNLLSFVLKFVPLQPQKSCGKKR